MTRNDAKVRETTCGYVKGVDCVNKTSGHSASLQAMTVTSRRWFSSTPALLRCRGTGGRTAGTGGMTSVAPSASPKVKQFGEVGVDAQVFGDRRRHEELRLTEVRRHNAVHRLRGHPRISHCGCWEFLSTTRDYRPEGRAGAARPNRRSPAQPRRCEEASERHPPQESGQPVLGQKHQRHAGEAYQHTGNGRPSVGRPNPRIPPRQPAMFKRKEAVHSARTSRPRGRRAGRRRRRGRGQAESRQRPCVHRTSA